MLSLLSFHEKFQQHFFVLTKNKKEIEKSMWTECHGAYLVKIEILSKKFYFFLKLLDFNKNLKNFKNQNKNKIKKKIKAN